jgi:hypothetical protein
MEVPVELLPIAFGSDHRSSAKRRTTTSQAKIQSERSDPHLPA